MTDAITGWIKTRREMEAAATEEPWEDDGGDIAQHWSRPEPWAMVVDTEVSCMAYCYGGSAAGVIRTEDAAFIVDARTSLPKALDALEAVAKLHEPGTMTCYSPSHTNPDAQCPECRVECTECGEDFPCPTVTAITSALEAGPR